MSHRISNSKLLLVAGYIHDYEKQFLIVIPSELYTMFYMFCPPNYKLFGIGMCEFGLSSKCNNIRKWRYLQTMTSLCYGPNFISCANSNIFLRNMNSEIYAIGNNLYGSLGINSSEPNISIFTKVKFKHNPIHDNNTLQLMSKGNFSNHTFCVFQNIYTNIQTFYAFGKNSSKQQGYNSSQNNFPRKVHSLNILFENIQIIQITTGYSHSLFLTKNGKVYSCGDNKY
eukprot:345990_1